MNKKFSSLVEYISLILRKYNDIQQSQMNNTFRVASVKNSGKAIKIIFQVIGKATFMECAPKDILSNDAFLEQFSKKDIQAITLAYAEDQNLKNPRQIENRLKILKHDFNANNGKTRFVLVDEDGKRITKSSAEIYLDKEAINNLSQLEAAKIGFVAGHEHAQLDTPG